MKQWAWLPAGLGWLLATAGILLHLLARPSLATVVPLLIALAFPGVATLLIHQRPQNPIGWLLYAFGLGVPFSILANEYGAIVLPALAVWFYWLDRWMWVLTLVPLVTILPLVFPTGRLPAPRWRWVLWIIIAGLILAALSVMIAPWPLSDGRVTNPTAVPELASILEAMFIAGLLLLATGASAAVFSVVWRYRRAAGEERLQLKWFISGASITILILVTSFTFSLMAHIPNELAIVINAAAALPLPLAIAVAIMRYRLWDIDFIIRRTLIYSVLTIALALVYFGSVIMLQSVVAGVGGQQSSAAIVLSTLAIAALFNPLRQRVQHMIDRRFYRRKVDAAQALAAFAATARDEVELERLAAGLVHAIEETMQPAHVSLWLKPASREIN